MRQQPAFVTFTGLDPAADLDRAAALGRNYPIEWGVLLSSTASLDPHEPRYPPFDWVALMARAAPLRLAAHVCGALGRSIFSGAADADHDAINWMRFGRIQVNICDAPNLDPMTAWGWVQRRNPLAHLVLQTADRFPTPTFLNFPASPPVHWLADASGGRGVTRTTWPTPLSTHLPVGYAGGINPDNVLNVLDQITEHHPRGTPFWIDMESGVRDARDRLHLGACTQVCQKIFDRSH